MILKRDENISSYFQFENALYQLSLFMNTGIRYSVELRDFSSGSTLTAAAEIGIMELWIYGIMDLWNYAWNYGVPWRIYIATVTKYKISNIHGRHFDTSQENHPTGHFLNSSLMQNIVKSVLYVEFERIQESMLSNVNPFTNWWRSLNL